MTKIKTMTSFLAMHEHVRVCCLPFISKNEFLSPLLVNMLYVYTSSCPMYWSLMSDMYFLDYDILELITRILKMSRSIRDLSTCIIPATSICYQPNKMIRTSPQYRYDGTSLAPNNDLFHQRAPCGPVVRLTLGPSNRCYR